MKEFLINRTYSRVVRNRVFYENLSLSPIDWVKNPVSLALIIQRVIAEHQLRFLIFNVEREEIVLWRN
jgi:hypothetical protein